ncbi:MAG: cupin domain-containing protein [Pseudomonadota bacterium]
MSAPATAETLIEQLSLAPHPEGGWYRETWRAPSNADGRAGGTAIVFLLKAGESSHWHRVDAEEIWIWQGGDPLNLRIAHSDAGPVKTLRLGGDMAAAEQLQGIVPTGAWQAAASALDCAEHGYTLVSCVVVPGFDFAGFTLATPGWEPGT